ncbi:hypothetical protein MKW98_032661 [Papaver atlanticum]|uniref:TF-B3 domain-containing protein n=1 Tax=Papaver atlanticum TaxID=357466 RepID=A0AAD4XJP6_9MAGN|nr:hypothetical protein MKW98_032661 [Papaver atlanticum]
MKKLVDPYRKHHFFKVILEDDETRMKIPEAFYPRISRESQSGGQAVVYGPSGAYWVTKVHKSQDGIFLEKGWEVFVRENGIQIYDFLVFRYDGSMQFSVKVFDMRGIPREECFVRIRSSPLSEERITHGRSSEHEADKNEDEPDDEESDEEESDEEKSYGDETDEDEDEYEVPRKTMKLNSSRKKRSKSIDVPRASRIERGFASSSRYPFFKIRMQNSYLKHNYLPIPWGTRRKYFPDDVKEVILKASDEKWSWKIRLLRSKTDLRLSKGVSDFIRKKNGMNLKIRDVCIFEIVEKRSHQLVLRVQIIRY